MSFLPASFTPWCPGRGPRAAVDVDCVRGGNVPWTWRAYGF